MTGKTLAALLVAPRKNRAARVPLPEIDDELGLAKVEIDRVCGADWPDLHRRPRPLRSPAADPRA